MFSTIREILMTPSTPLTPELRRRFQATTDCSHAHPLARAVACARRDYVASWRQHPAMQARERARYMAALAAVEAAP